MNVKFLYAEKLEALMNARDELDNGNFIFCFETDRLYVKMHEQLIGITPKRRAIIELKCKNCGSPMSGSGSIIKCDYCGSVYDIDNWSNDVE